MRITAELLQEHGACRPMVRRFRHLFPKRKYPNGVVLTVTLAKKYWREFLIPSWIVENLFTCKLRGLYWNTMWGMSCRERWLIIARLSKHIPN